MIDLNTQQVYDRASDALGACKPFGLVRWGDGEWMIADPCVSDSVREKAILCHYGSPQSEPALRALRGGLIAAVAAADVVGLHEPAATKFGDSRLFLEPLLRPQQDTCSANVHFHLQESGLLLRLCAQASLVVVASGHSLAAKIAAVSKAPAMNLPTPLQAKFFGAPLRDAAAEREELLHMCRESPLRPGSLLLVAAGPGGKELVVAAKNMGAVAIDIGSVADRWAGYVTRGKEKGFCRRPEPGSDWERWAL